MTRQTTFTNTFAYKSLTKTMTQFTIYSRIESVLAPTATFYSASLQSGTGQKNKHPNREKLGEKTSRTLFCFSLFMKAVFIIPPPPPSPEPSHEILSRIPTLHMSLPSRLRSFRLYVFLALRVIDQPRGKRGMRCHQGTCRWLPCRAFRKLLFLTAPSFTARLPVARKPLCWDGSGNKEQPHADCARRNASIRNRTQTEIIRSMNL